MFHHNHWNSYSEERRAQLLAENASLKTELDRLKSTPVDPNYVPDGVDADLIYSDSFVKAAYGKEKTVEESSPWLTIFLLSLTAASFGTGVYFLFVRRT
jgi:hypothetical protein